MKVRVVLSVDVDPQAYRDEYADQSMTAAEIAEAIRSSIADAARTPGIVAPDGIIRDVTQKES